MKNIKYLLFLLMLTAFHQTKAQNTTVTFNQILNAYFDVEKALAEDNIREANKNSASMVRAIEAMNTVQLNAKQKEAWKTYGEKLRYNSQHISESRTIDHQREHFASLSDEMYGLLKTFKTHPTVYRQYCPMKKQYWLNALPKIQNPYYGKAMQDCGKVAETLTGTASAIMIQ